MADLRWILLLVGLAFLAALAAWESRRPRQGRRDALNPTERGEPAIGEMEQADASSSVPMPSISMRAPFNNPRVRVMVPVRVELPPLDPEDIAEVEQFGDEPGSVSAAQPQPQIDEPMVALPDSQIVLPTIRAMQSHSGFEQQPVAAATPLTPTVEPIVVGRTVEPIVVGRTIEPIVAEPTLEPIVEWPPESQRHVISVRVVGVNSDRMSGRPLRQALAACGFVHGRFGIFHQPGVDGRALVSAANLHKPGVFDPGNMDFQRFRGLGLFAVLPGPLPPAAALDHLLDTAGDLAQRLHARLLDEQGQPLDEARLEALARTVHDMSNSLLRSEPAA
jgi:FtsZ-interacting cell division protein ZipA